MLATLLADAARHVRRLDSRTELWPGDVGQTGHVAGQQFLTDRSVQNLGDLARLHSYSSRCPSRSIQVDRSGWSQVGGDGPLAELLGQRDDDPLGAADVAEPVAVLVLHQLADEFGAVSAQAGNDILDVVDGEHDAT